MTVDPDLVDELRVRFGALDPAHRAGSSSPSSRTSSRRCSSAGWTDGLPVVPPTEERVLRMLDGHDRDRPTRSSPWSRPTSSSHGREGRDQRGDGRAAGPSTSRGCSPRSRPCAPTSSTCTALLATTMPVGPVIVCNGPGTRAIGMNSGINALGQGNRANSTIGRALQLVVRNVGGGRPGRGRPGHARQPGQGLVLLRRGRGGLAVDARRQPRRPARRRRGHGVRRRGPALRRRSAVARRPRALASSLRRACAPCTIPKLPLGFDAILVIGPEHARVFAEAGWDRDRILAELHAAAAAPRQRDRARRRRHRRGRAGGARRRHAAEVPARTACCSCTPAAAPGCSRPSSAAGRTVTSAARR